jgi:hypothetical protein
VSEDEGTQQARAEYERGRVAQRAYR